MNEKTKLEKAALDYFVEAYNNRGFTKLKFKKHSDKPDFIVEDSQTNRAIGIEIKHLYYDCDEAKILLDRSDKPIHNMMNSTKIIMKLNKLLQNAAESAKKYGFKDELFLIVRVASPIFDKSSFDMFEGDIVIPSILFKEIWLLFYDFSRQAWGELKKLK